MTSLLKVINDISNINNLFTYKNIKKNNQVLDPLSCMVRLAILKYKPYGTKISICNNSIIFQDPSLLQGSIRWKNGDTRLDIHNLLITIQKAIDWYDLTDDKIIYIYETSKDGIIELLKSYNGSSNTSHTLKYYINIINNALENNKKFKEEITNEKDVYYKPFKNIWSKRKINIIFHILKEIKDISNEEQKYMIKSLEHILYHKDKKVKEIVKDISSSL